MTRRSRGWLAGALLLGLSWAGGDCRAGMTLQFNIEPTTQPHMGSLGRHSDDTLQGTNLAVTSVSSINTGASVDVSKYMDFHSMSGTAAGPADFFVIDQQIEHANGSSPAAFTAKTGVQSLKQLADGSFLFTMRISYGFVGDDVIDHFGSANEYGWSGLLTLHIGAFDNSLAGSQVSSGTLVLTSLDPVPAGEMITPAAVPEPASALMAGFGLLVVARCGTRLRRVAV